MFMSVHAHRVLKSINEPAVEVSRDESVNDVKMTAEVTKQVLRLIHHQHHLSEPGLIIPILEICVKTLKSSELCTCICTLTIWPILYTCFADNHACRLLHHVRLDRSIW